MGDCAEGRYLHTMNDHIREGDLYVVDRFFLLAGEGDILKIYGSLFRTPTLPLRKQCITGNA